MDVVLLGKHGYDSKYSSSTSHTKTSKHSHTCIYAQFGTVHGAVSASMSSASLAADLPRFRSRLSESKRHVNPA